jgi:hypothetical protein
MHKVWPGIRIRIYGENSVDSKDTLRSQDKLHLSLEFISFNADADVWMRPAVKLDGTEYYELIFVHTDFIFVLSTNPNDILMCLDLHYMLKPGSIGKPNQFLGYEVGEYCLPDDPTKVQWYCSSDKYIREQFAMSPIGLKVGSRLYVKK